MHKPIVFTLAIGALAVFFMTGLSEQPEKGPKKGPPDKKGWEPGKIIPPFVRDALEFTERKTPRSTSWKKMSAPSCSRFSPRTNSNASSK